MISAAFPYQNKWRSVLGRENGGRGSARPMGADPGIDVKVNHWLIVVVTWCCCRPPRPVAFKFPDLSGH